MGRSVWLTMLAAACAGGKAGNDSGAGAGADGTGGTGADPVEALAMRGDYGVGYSRGALTYADPISGADRELVLALWYPSSDDTTGQMADYDLPVPIVSDPVPGHDVGTDAALASGSFPVALFTHGMDGYAEASSELMAHLASHGWLVVAPEHPGSSLRLDDDRTTDTYLQQPGDIVATLDHVLGGSEPAFGSTVNSDAVVVLGHSYGGYALLATAGLPFDVAGLEAFCADSTQDRCSNLSESNLAAFSAGFNEARVDAWIPMAAGDSVMFDLDGTSANAPVLVLSGAQDTPKVEETDAFWGALQGGSNRWVEIAGGGHQTFTDYSARLEVFDGVIPLEEGNRIVFSYVLAFARLHALGDTEMQSVIDGEVEISSEATLSR